MWLLKKVFKTIYALSNNDVHDLQQCQKEMSFSLINWRRLFLENWIFAWIFAIFCMFFYTRQITSDEPNECSPYLHTQLPQDFLSIFCHHICLETTPLPHINLSPSGLQTKLLQIFLISYAYYISAHSIRLNFDS